jgi:hypothetical protein
MNYIAQPKGYWNSKTIDDQFVRRASPVTNATANAFPINHGPKAS